jgi:hypothetical protein
MQVNNSYFRSFPSSRTPFSFIFINFAYSHTESGPGFTSFSFNLPLSGISIHFDAPNGKSIFSSFICALGSKYFASRVSIRVHAFRSAQECLDYVQMVWPDAKLTKAPLLFESVFIFMFLF